MLIEKYYSSDYKARRKPDNLLYKKYNFSYHLHKRSRMNEKDFDPGGVGIPNGNYFGFPYTPEEADVLLISVPWDVTTSYNAGSSYGPKAILDASNQLDFFDPEIPKAWEIGIGTDPFNDDLLKKSKRLRAEAEEVINHLENGGSLTDPEITESLAKVNDGSKELNSWLYEKSKTALAADKLVGVVGGDHSVPFGLLRALSEKHTGFGILQIDAHADLRRAYEGFEYSHASIMYNAMNLKSIEKIVHLGVRDLCEVAPGEDEWDANVGARILYKLTNLMYTSNRGVQ